MKKLKKIIALALLLTMTPQLYSCNSNNNSLDNDSSLVDEGKTHTLSFDTDGGNEITSIVQETGTNIKMPYDPIKEGYTFIGWDKKVPDTMPNSDMTFKAQWIEGTMKFSIERNGTATIISYMGEAKELILPDIIYNEYKVIQIKENAFSMCSSLISVSISNSITTIGKRAFQFCNSMLTITIPSSVTEIGNWAFSDCTLLTIYCESFSKQNGWDIYWNPDNRLVYYGITKDNKIEKDGIIYVIQDNEAIVTRYVGKDTSVTIPNTIELNGKTYKVTTIGKRAFYKCISLKDIKLPNTISIIGEYAFSNCSLLNSILLPHSITTIGQYAFSSCSLTNVILPNCITKIEKGVFEFCSSLKYVSIPNNVQTIEESAFYFCTAIVSITIPNSVAKIGNSAFSDCRSLTSITFLDGLIEIGDEAFKNCSSLTNIIFPNSLATIGNSSFKGCISLTLINIPNSVTTIGNSTFRDCTSLLNITLSDSLTTIGEYAFTNCTSLLIIAIPNSVTTIGKNAFSSCLSLIIYCESNTQQSGWHNDKYYLTSWNPDNRLVYYGITKDNKIEKDGIMYIIQNNEAIITRYVGNDNSIIIPRTIEMNKKSYNVTKIGENAFYKCTSLSNIRIPSSVTTIGKYAFYNCSLLTSIYIPNSVTTIENFSFTGCKFLTIYCEAETQPSEWDSNWNPDNCRIYWNVSNYNL